MRLNVRVNFVPLITFVFLSCTAKYDTIKEYVNENVVSINSISPADTNYRDLEEIGKSIGKAKIVMLGEQDHGDAPTFLAKTRLIKYFHEELGFNIVAFESDFYGLYKLNESSTKPAKASIENNIYTIWSNCSEVSGLFDYYEKSEKLRIFGIDCRMSLPYSKANFLNEIATLKLPLDDSIRFYNILKDVIDLEYQHHPSIEDQTFFFNEIDKAQKNFGKENFHAQSLQNLKEFANNSWNGKQTMNIRDRQMAKNLAWLAKTLSEEKIIVWAHNFHISKNVHLTDNISDEMLSGTSATMGSELTHYFNMEDIYVLGFSSLQGKWGRINMAPKHEVGIANSNGLENWISNKGIKVGFVDFSKLKDDVLRNEKFELKGYSHAPSMNLPWGQIYDGLFYIQDMYPCEEK